MTEHARSWDNVVDMDGRTRTDDLTRTERLAMRMRQRQELLRGITWESCPQIEKDFWLDLARVAEDELLGEGS